MKGILFVVVTLLVGHHVHGADNQTVKVDKEPVETPVDVPAGVTNETEADDQTSSATSLRNSYNSNSYTSSLSSGLSSYGQEVNPVSNYGSSLVTSYGKLKPVSNYDVIAVSDYNSNPVPSYDVPVNDYNTASSYDVNLVGSYDVNSVGNYDVNSVGNYGQAAAVPNYGNTVSNYGLVNPVSNYGQVAPVSNYGNLASNYGQVNPLAGYAQGLPNYAANLPTLGYNNQHSSYSRRPQLCSRLGSAVYSGSQCCSNAIGIVDNSGLQKCCQPSGTTCDPLKNMCCNGMFCQHHGPPDSDNWSCMDPSVVDYGHGDGLYRDPKLNINCWALKGDEGCITDESRIIKNAHGKAHGLIGPIG